MSATTQKIRVISKNGKPQSVVLDISVYERLLEIAEDKQDLLELKRIKKQGASFKELDQIMAHAL
jgi:hypothetical protein